MRTILFKAATSAAAAALLLPSLALADAVDKGHRILIERGIQSTGMITKDDVFHLATYQNAGFTAANWIWVSENSKLGAAPGIPWARWASGISDMPPLAGEENYMSNLVAISMGDEQNLADPGIRANTATWYDTVRANFPNTILFTNQYGGQLSNPDLAAFISECHPDMLSFDTYPFGVGGPAGGSPTNLYGDMQRYRKFALSNGLPYAMYTQTYHADSEARRDPSDSELHLNYFAGLSFGFTYFSCFTYNTGASSLFTSPGGDSYPKPLYASMQDVNARLKKLSPTMTRLKSSLKYKTVSSQTRELGIMFYLGEHLDNGTTTPNAYPVDFSFYPGDFFTWYQGTNDPWLRGMTVTNLGTKNDGLRGDVVMTYFKVLSEEFDGSGYSDETYIMILNGLTAPDGTAAECRQRVKLNYLSTAPGEIQRLNQQTGQVETISIPVDQATGRRLPSFDIDGGCCEIFKFNTGAPFVGFAQTAAKNWKEYR